MQQHPVDVVHDPQLSVFDAAVLVREHLVRASTTQMSKSRWANYFVGWNLQQYYEW